MRPIPPLSVSPYLYLAAISGDIKIPGSDKLNQSREIWQFIMGLTTQSGIVLWVPCSGQILIVQARGAFTLGGTELGRSCISGYHDMRVGSREGHTWRESSSPALYNEMLVNDWYTQHTVPCLRVTFLLCLRFFVILNFPRGHSKSTYDRGGRGGRG